MLRELLAVQEDFVGEGGLVVKRAIHILLGPLHTLSAHLDVNDLRAVQRIRDSD